MARKATPATNGRKAKQAALPAVVVELPAPDPSRRGRKPKLRETREATISLADQFFPGRDDPAESARPLPESPAKIRRGRKPKEQAAPTLAAMGKDDTAGVAEMDHPEPTLQAEPPAKARRGRKPKEQPAPMPAAMDDDETSAVAETEHAEPTPDAEPPAKARRGRKPKPQNAPEMPAADDDHAAAIVAELEQAEPAMRMDADAPASVASAAHWDSKTGSVIFNWPAIEQVAAQDGPNQAMAKLLLAARAEGANSRWPF